MSKRLATVASKVEEELGSDRTEAFFGGQVVFEWCSNDSGVGAFQIAGFCTSALRTVHKLGVEQFRLHTLNQQHISDIPETTSPQSSQLCMCTFVRQPPAPSRLERCGAWLINCLL